MFISPHSMTDLTMLHSLFTGRCIDLRIVMRVIPSIFQVGTAWALILFDTGHRQAAMRIIQQPKLNVTTMTGSDATYLPERQENDALVGRLS